MVQRAQNFEGVKRRRAPHGSFRYSVYHIGVLLISKSYSLGSIFEPPLTPILCHEVPGPLYTPVDPGADLSRGQRSRPRSLLLCWCLHLDCLLSFRRSLPHQVSIASLSSPSTCAAAAPAPSLAAPSCRGSGSTYSKLQEAL